MEWMDHSNDDNNNSNRIAASKSIAFNHIIRNQAFILFDLNRFAFFIQANIHKSHKCINGIFPLNHQHTQKKGVDYIGKRFR